MLLVNQIKVSPGFTIEHLKKKTADLLRVSPDKFITFDICKLSVDARKKDNILYIVSVLVTLTNENSILKSCKSGQVSLYNEPKYNPGDFGNIPLQHRPVVVGAGPAGLFSAYFLARYGFKPILLERGYDIETRTKDVNEFWEKGILNVNSNVQFGEGGAGAFSDGKLNTLVNDHFGRNKEVLKLFVECGANPDILYESKPHIGTDILYKVVKNLREKIKSYGGEVRFNAQVTKINISQGRISSLTINDLYDIPVDVCILAIGHSARDTFEMLYSLDVPLESKNFSVGFRIEHSQELINEALYGTKYDKNTLPVGSYKLSYKGSENRGVYSFCMCPGGYVVNASSEKGRTCVNGMSYKARDGKNANSAIVVTVDEREFNGDSPLKGMYFQRELEERAFIAGKGNIPCEYYKDFKNEVISGLTDISGTVSKNSIEPETKGNYVFTSLKDILPDNLNENLVEAIEYFNRIIPGFSGDYAILSGVESRTSSPVRITRNDEFESIKVKGLYPAGEGAGYAGGIMSAAMDGMKVFEAVLNKYKPDYEV